jgi:hypothetical protein
VAALKQTHGLDWPLPRLGCPDLLVARVPDDGGTPRLHGISTAECEHLPKLTVVGNHAVVASVLSVPKAPEPNDTSQYDIGVSIVDLTTGAVISRRFAFVEDDWVEAIAPCGPNVCVAGTTGAKSVDTGSVVTYGTGFVLPVSLSGEPGKVWHVTSPRHAVIQHLAPGKEGLLFFATVNGPITHTADQDPLLGFNEGLLGIVGGI